MRPEPGPRRFLSLMAALVLAATTGLMALGAWAAETPSPPQWSEVEAARKTLLEDPNIGGKGTRTVWRWQSGPDGGNPDSPPSPANGGTWTALKLIAEGLRVFVWVAGALAILFVLLHLRQWWATRADAREASLSMAPPTHVRDLDIRPESLPDDIGAAAWRTWTGGEPRAALSLLYRGALSRLVHGHGVTVQASSTEGECLGACQAQARACARYFGQLVRVWQMAVYGDHPPAEATVRDLCERFHAELGPAGRPAPAAGAVSVGRA